MFGKGPVKGSLGSLLPYLSVNILYLLGHCQPFPHLLHIWTLFANPSEMTFFTQI